MGGGGYYYIEYVWCSGSIGQLYKYVVREVVILWVWLGMEQE